MELFVLKDDAKRLVTGPVAIPECPDCDYPRGEKLLTVDEIEGMVHEYNTRSQMADAMHVYGATKQTIGVAVENWTLKEPLTTKNIRGDNVVLPRGTWMTTIKVTDDDTWQKIQDGTYQGFSASYMSREDAEQVLASKRVLIADLEDPMPVTISIVDQPCVFDAIFCSVKMDESVDKAGRKISNATLKKIQDAFDNIKTLINDALTERGVETEDANKEMEELTMDEEKLQEIIREAVKAELESQRETETEEVEEVEETVEEVEEEVEETEPTEPEAEPIEPTEAEKQLATAQERIKELEKQVAKSKGLRGQDDTPEPVADKRRVEEGRDIYGRKIKA